MLSPIYPKYTSLSVFFDKGSMICFKEMFLAKILIFLTSIILH